MHWSPHSCCCCVVEGCVDWCLCVCIAMWHAALAPDLSWTSLHCAVSGGQCSSGSQQGFTSYKYLQGFTIYLQICWKLGNWREDLIFWHCVGVLAGELQKCRLEVSEYGIAFTFCFNFYVNLATLTSPCVTWWLNFHLKLITEHLGWGNLHNIFRV